MIIKTNCDPKKISNACGKIEETNPLLEEVIDFYEKIFLLQADSFKTLKIKPVLISKDLLQKKLEEKFPLISREEFSIDFKASEYIFEKICELCSDYNIKDHEQANALLKKIHDHELSFREIAEKFLSQDDSWLDDFTKENDLEKPSIEFLFYNSMKPSIVECSEQLASFLGNDSAQSQTQGYCPVCGSMPGVSLLSSENGARSFTCSFCWHEWKTQRIFCPFCGTRDSKKLSYLEIEGKKEIRGDVCDQCMKYIKTIDLRECKNDIYLPLELLAAIPLDMKLDEEGYTSGNII